MAIRLRTLDAEYPVSNAAIAADLAPFWRTTLEKRKTVSQLAGLRHNIAKQSQTDLQHLCPSLEEIQLEKLAGAGLVEVCLSGEDALGGAAWEIPWEFLLSAATEHKRNRSRPLLVLRHLDAGTPGRSPFSEPAHLLVVKNNPGILGDLYTDVTFLREERNVAAHLNLQQLSSLHNENLDWITSQIRRNKPSVIHVTGVDSQQAAGFSSSISIPDEEALMIESNHGGIEAATAAQISPALRAGDDKPVLVSLNFVNSACRIAPSLVRDGAGAVISFFNDFDDIVAETFFANFYLGWRLARWNLLDAFRLAWSQIPSPTPERLWGTGLVFWCRESLIGREREGCPRLPATPAARPYNWRRSSC